MCHCYDILKWVSLNSNEKEHYIAISPDQPRERSDIVIRAQVWVTYNAQPEWGECYCCGGAIRYNSPKWCCTPVKLIKNGGDLSIGNLRPCCKTCYEARGKQDLYTYIRTTGLHGPGSKAIPSIHKASGGK